MFIPIFLRILCSIYQLIMSSLTEKHASDGEEKKTFKLKDVNCLEPLNKMNTLVTTIDTFHSPNVRLHSIKVREIYHNFENRQIDDELYST